MQAARVAVARGSIAGLTAACLLRDAGHDVTLFERSSTELEQRGAGIGLLEATSRYLVTRAGIDQALADWEPRQVRLGRALVEGARRIGRRSQVDNAWVPGDPELLFGLHAAGER